MTTLSHILSSRGPQQRAVAIQSLDWLGTLSLPKWLDCFGSARRALPRNDMLRAGLAVLASCCLATAVSAAGGSLWPAGGIERGMTADRRAARTGDILTVLVAEMANATTAQSKSSNRESSIDDAISQFVFSKGLSHGGEMPSLSLSGKSAYSGGGQVNNTQSLTARAAVLVTDVLPNGTLVVEGTRRITFSGETQYVVLHGLVRPDDISSNNTVLSSNVADARVEFVAEGSLTDAQKRGWLAKLYEKLRPF